MDTFLAWSTGFWGGFVVGGLVVGFWSSKIWPWIKTKTSAAETKVSADVAKKL